MNDKTSLPSEIADTKGKGTIRLGCVHCDRRDQDGICKSIRSFPKSSIAIAMLAPM